MNDGKERLLGVYPGDFKNDYDLTKLIVKATDITEGIDLAKNRNLAIIVPPTKMNNQTLVTPVFVAVVFGIAFIVTKIMKKKHIK